MFQFHAISLKRILYKKFQAVIKDSCYFKDDTNIYKVEFSWAILYLFHVSYINYIFLKYILFKSF